MQYKQQNIQRSKPLNETNEQGLINFELTQQNMLLTNKSKKSYLNDDDLVYSENQNSFCQSYENMNRFNNRQVLTDRLNVNMNKKNQLQPINLQQNQSINKSQFKKVGNTKNMKIKTQKTIQNQNDQQRESMTQNFIENKSLFFPIKSGSQLEKVNFRVKRRLDIKIILQNVYKTERSRAQTQRSEN